jgi:two-component system phosphate regulon sensor histidine kinase PhoR
MPLPALALKLLEAMDEPSLLIERGRVVSANGRARELLGQGIVDRDVRLAIRHPEALELIFDADLSSTHDIDLIGIGSAEQSWRMILQPLDDSGLRLVRLIDRSHIRAAERMRVDFVANASHELRTPLATISGYAETLADDGPLDDELRRRFGSTIGVEAARMLRLIEQLMGLSRIEADRYRAPSEPVDLPAIVKQAIDDCGEFARRRRARIRVTADPDVPPGLGDSSQLLQVVTNLIINALRYGCTADGCPIAITIRRRGEREAEVAVRDEGQGMAAEHLPRVTERFYRIDEARTRDQGGTGLGLAIVKHIVERHRGRLGIRSEPHQGTEVTVALPVA